MKKKVKKLWVEALKSGEYSQGTGGLRDGDLFCCLGVLCDIHAKETSSEWAAPTFKSFSSYSGYTVTLPTKVAKWAGLENNDPIVKSPSGTDEEHLSVLNDGGATFEQIAGLIDEQL
jgi:hypothetical protein